MFAGPSFPSPRALVQCRLPAQELRDLGTACLIGEKSLHPRRAPCGLALNLPAALQGPQEEQPFL